MCGVAGAFLQPDGARLVQTMSDRIGHRGPDAHGLTDLSPDSSLQLAHRRLSIIDLSAAADQPFVKDGLHLSYNGELYNYRELRKILRGKGVRFSTESDTEVVLEAWRHWGPAALPRASAGCSRSRSTTSAAAALTLVRDPLGIKPMYVMPRGSGILFASELKALVAAVGPELTVDPDGLVASTLFYFLPEERSRRQRSLQASSRIRGPNGGPTAPSAAAATGILPRRPSPPLPARPPTLADGTRGVGRRAPGGRRAGRVLSQRRPGLEPHHRDGREPGPLDRGLHDHLPSRGSASRGDARRRRLRPQDGRAPGDPTARDRDQPGRRGHAASGRRHPRRAHRRPGRDQHRAHVPGRPGSRRQGAAVGDGRRRAVRRLPQAPGLRSGREVPDAPADASHRAWSRRAWTGCRSRPAGAGFGTAAGPSASSASPSCRRRRRSAAATPSTTRPSLRRCSTPSWHRGCTAWWTRIAACTPTTGWPTTSTGCA